MDFGVHRKQPWVWFQWMNWHRRGVIVRVGTLQFDIFWAPKWGEVDED